MPEARSTHSTDIYVKRERWRDGYHSVARQNGHFISSRKWKSSEDTHKTLNNAWKNNIIEDEPGSETHGRYSLLFQGKNAIGEARSYSVGIRRRVFEGSKKKRKLHDKPARTYAMTKYSDPRQPSPTIIKITKLKSVYEFGVKLR